jgi:hypothetical protein
MCDIKNIDFDVFDAIRREFEFALESKGLGVWLIAGKTRQMNVRGS